MTHSEPKKKLDDLLRGAVDLRPKPDFAEWRQQHPDAIDALQSLPAVLVKRRLTMARTIRYGTSALAIALLLVAGAWWMFFSNSVQRSWAQVIDQLGQIRCATCTLRAHGGGGEDISTVYLEGSRVRLEDSYRIVILDFLEGKMLSADTRSRTAIVGNITSESMIVLGSNPLNDLIQMKNSPAERLPDETVEDMLCRVYRAKTNTFIGFQVPWVKLWLDPQSGLPVQFHAVVADGRMSWTFSDFHWNEPFDRNLLNLDVPEGFTLAPDLQKPVSTTSADQTAAETEAKQTGSDEQEGRRIPTDEIADTLEMLCKRIEANYKAMASWSGTYDLVGRSVGGTPGDTYQLASHAAVEFYAQMNQDCIRIDYREIEPTVIDRPNVRAASIDSRWVRTPEHLLQFSPSTQMNNVEGFPRIENGPPGSFRVLYREPPKVAYRYVYQGYIDPRSLFGNGIDRPYWELFTQTIRAFRGDPKLSPSVVKHAKKYTVLRERQKNDGKEFILFQQATPIEAEQTHEWIFSSEAGFNVVSERFLQNGKPRHTRRCVFHSEKGIFIPSEAEENHFDSLDGKEPMPSPTRYRKWKLTTTQVNEPIDPVVFEPSSLGLKEGDRMVDRIENQMQVFDGKQFVPAQKFKLQPAATRKREDFQSAKSTNQLKQIALGMLEYESAKKSLPPAFSVDKDGKPLLSWRVLILPFIEQNGLYKQFHLDEPWDSEHNKPLADKMPEVFKSPRSALSHEGKTNYLTVRGEGTAFPSNKAMTISDIKDGTSNTIMVVEASDDRAVVWTKPDDFEYDEQDPIKGLVGLWPDGFWTSFVDGSVHLIPSTTDPAILKLFFLRNSGQVKDRQALVK